MKRLAVIIVLLLLSLVATGTAAASKRRVPFGFFGTVMDPELPIDASPAALDGQMGLMARSGVESVRTNFYWDAAEPAPPPAPYDWTATDGIVRAAASHGLELLPIVEFTPRWASSHPSSAWDEYAPSNPQTYATFVSALVGRYGPKGSFWAANPQVPRIPIRDWQIWNEPAGTNYDWRSQPWPRTYTTLLKAAYTAIHHADRGAKVVTGALVGLNTTTLTPWAETTDLYRAGAGRYFDVLAVNAFTNAPAVSASVDRSLEIVRRVRVVMSHNGGAKRPVWVTELTWTAAAGRIPKSDYAGFETTARGQAQRLSAYYNRVAAKPTDGIQRVFWYTWESSYTAQSLFANTPTFQFSGLVSWQPGQPFRPLPVLSSYASVAAKFEGCHKSSNARRPC